MIQFVRGKLFAVEEDRILIDVGGIGYGIFMSGSAMSRLPQLGQEVFVYTYMSVKEDAMHLFGFSNRDELKIFKLLIGVNGIGPKGAIAILSALSPDDLRFAVVSNDVKGISKAPGIGKKTAEKIILELKDKLSIEDMFNDEEMPASVNCKESEQCQEVMNEAVQALVALGYSNTDAFKAVKKVDITENVGVNEVIKQALKNVMVF